MGREMQAMVVHLMVLWQKMATIEPWAQNEFQQDDLILKLSVNLVREPSGRI